MKELYDLRCAIEVLATVRFDELMVRDDYGWVALLCERWTTRFLGKHKGEVRILISPEPKRGYMEVQVDCKPDARYRLPSGRWSRWYPCYWKLRALACRVVGRTKVPTVWVKLVKVK